MWMVRLVHVWYDVFNPVYCMRMQTIRLHRCDTLQSLLGNVCLHIALITTTVYMQRIHWIFCGRERTRNLNYTLQMSSAMGKTSAKNFIIPYIDYMFLTLNIHWFIIRYAFAHHLIICQYFQRYILLIPSSFETCLIQSACHIQVLSDFVYRTI